MPPLVIRSDGAGGHAVASRQLVDQRGFSHAGGAQEGHRLAGDNVGQHRLIVAAQGRDGQDLHAGSGTLHLGDHAVHIRAQIRLGEHHHRRGAAVVGDGEVALQAAEVEVLVQRHADQHRVDIGGHHLLLFGAAGGPPDEAALPWKEAADDGGIVALRPLGQDIVAHRRIVGDGQRLVPVFSGDGRLLDRRSVADPI